MKSWLALRWVHSFQSRVPPPSKDRGGQLNLHLHPSPILNASRLLRISGSLQESGLFAGTHLVGTTQRGLARGEDLGHGLTIERIPATAQGTHTASKMMRGFAWYPRVVFRYSRSNVGVVNAHTVFVLPAAWVLCKLTHAKFVYNPHELETGTPSMRGLKLVLAQIMELLFVRRCDLVTTVNQSIGDWYSAKFGIHPIVVRNIPLSEPSSLRIRQIAGVSDKEILYVHTGRLVRGRNISVILHVFENLPADSLASVVFIGDGPLTAEVRKASTRSRRVNWMAPVPCAQVVDLIREADVALSLIDVRSLSYRLSSPNKLFEALAAGIPPLCSDLVEARRLMGDTFDSWVIKDPKVDLELAVRKISHQDLQSFSIAWPGIGTWTSEIEPMVSRFRELLQADG